jgi:hydroxymethylglutaryl-CoA lyase
MPKFPPNVRIVEVGPRDGLQNEAAVLSTADKKAFIETLTDSGLSEIEVTAFVNPAKVPQMADAMDLAQQLPQKAGVTYTALIANQRGLDNALACGLKRVAVFTATSDSFTQRNINQTVSESLTRFEPLVQQALGAGLSLRGYVSTAFYCPYEGRMSVARLQTVIQTLLDMGVDEVSVGDTIGAAVPSDVEGVVSCLLSEFSADQLAMHFHDTSGTALANVYAALRLGIYRFDSSAGGLGGCPYAPGAAGNLATEDLLYMLHQMGIITGVSLEKVQQASNQLAQALGRTLPSRQLARLNGQA